MWMGRIDTLKIMKKVIDTIKQYAQAGFFHIFGSGVLAQIGGLISSIIVIRPLPKEAYGYYANANNLYSYLYAFIGLGFSAAILQYCSEKVSERKKNSIYRFTLFNGTLANAFICLVILLMAAFKEHSGSPQTAHYLRLMSGLPFVVYAMNFFSTALRVKLENKAYSYSNIIYSVTILTCNIVFTLLWSIEGLILSMYLANIVSACSCALALSRKNFFREVLAADFRLDNGEKRSITSFAAVCATTNFASSVLVLLDITCLDYVLGDAAILADYRVASMIPTACMFVPSSLIIFFYPQLVMKFSESRELGKRELKKLAGIFGAINSAVGILLIMVAPLAIWLIFGRKYLNVIPVFIVLSINYMVHSIRMLLGNAIAAIKHVKVNLAISIISGIINVALDLMLIPVLGSVGAAVATLSVSLIVLGMELIFFARYFKKA